MSLKYLSALSYKTGYFLTASESRSSCYAAIFILFSLHVFHFLAHIASRVHITKIMKQVWNKANFEAWSEARYQNFDTLVSLLASYFTLPSLTSRMLTLYLHLLLRLPLRLLHKCEPGLKAHTYLTKPTAKSCRFI